MTIHFLGVGEAFDETTANTSALLVGPKTLLLDCGFAIPAQAWRAGFGGDQIDLIYLSHAHADHYFGLPALLGRMWEERRTKPLTLMSQPSVLEKVDAVLELGYAGLRERFQYPIQLLPISEAEPATWEGHTFRFAPTRHSSSNLAVRIDSPDGTVCYSGDGASTDESQALFAGSDVLLHEAYAFQETPVHGEIMGVIRLAAEAGVGTLALLHLHRTVRTGERERIADVIRAETRLTVLLPEPGDTLAVSRRC